MQSRLAAAGTARRHTGSRCSEGETGGSMRCKNCGAKCPNKATYCTSCGKKLEKRVGKRSLMGTIVCVLIVAAARTAGDELFGPKFQKPSARDVAITLSDIDNERLRSYLSDVADSDSDGLISDVEAGRVTSLGEVDDSGSVTDGGVSGMGLDDVGFISSFKNLETLVCEDNGLDQIDLSRNPAIKVLCCRGNNLTSLSVPKTLNRLYAAGNPITKIDLSGCDSLEKVEVDDSVEVSAASYAPSEDEYAKASALVCTYIVSHDPYGELAEKGTVFSASDSEADPSLFFYALYPGTGYCELSCLDSAGDLKELPSYAVDALGMKYQSGGCFLTEDDIKKMLSSFYGVYAPSDLSGLDEYKKGNVWNFPCVTAADTKNITLSNFEKYGNHMRVRASIRFNGGCDADPNDELWDEQIYEVILAENPDSIYGYSFERATCLESNHHEPEVKLSDLTGYYLLNPSDEADVSIEGDVVTITAQLYYYESESQTTPTSLLPRDTYVFRYADNCKFEGFCPESRVPIFRCDFERVLKQEYRELLVIVAEHGEITCGQIIS